MGTGTSTGATGTSTGATGTSTGATGASTSGTGANGTGGGLSNDTYVSPPDAVVAGKTYGEWSAEWYKWVQAIPKSTSPLLDGACDQQQPNGVFFLAGNKGGTYVRSCTIPSGTPIFFPVLNVLRKSCPETDCAKDTAYVMNVTDLFDSDGLTTIYVEIDGTSLGELTKYRAATGVFDDNQGADPNEQIFPTCAAGPIQANTCGIAEGSPRPDAGDGYWIMMLPPTAGAHTVHFGGELSTGFMLDVTYNLTISP
jgi:hypothetical protein